MKNEVMKAVVADGLPAVAVPVFRMWVSNHYTKKQMRMRRDLELERIEMKQKAMSKFGVPRRRLRPMQDVYSALDQFREEVDCGFCQSAASALMEAPEEDAKRGYEELMMYQDQVEPLGAQGVSQQEAEQVISDVLDQWEVIPEYLAS